MTENRSSRIEALFKSYRESLPALVVELEWSMSALSAHWDSDLASEFDRKVHGLAGSAATFDLPEIGDMARKLEHAFKPLVDTYSGSDQLLESQQLFIQLKNTIASSLD